MALVPFIDQSFEGQIWRMEIDELTDTLFLEIRNNADKQVSFASINLNTRTMNFKGLTMPERWLTGMECAFDGVLLLHNYQSDSAPVHKAVVAIDGRDGHMLWADYNLAFDHLSARGPVLYDTRSLPHRLLIADIKTGATTRLENASDDKNVLSNLSFPEIRVANIIPASIFPGMAVGNLMHYLDYNNYRIVSLHTSEKGVLAQLLLIAENNEVIYKDLLNAGIQKIQPEAFIMHKNRLIYIKNKTDLLMVVL